MGLVGLGLEVEGAFAHILDGHGGNDDHDIIEASVGIGLNEHACHARVEGDAGEIPADGGERGLVLLVVEGAELVEERETIADGLVLGRLDEGELFDITELERNHLEDDTREVGAQDFWVGELGTAFKILFAVEADGDAVGNAAATAGALVGGGLRDGLDGQPLDLGARGIPRDAGGAGINHIADAGHSKRGFCNIRGQHDAAATVFAENAVLFLVR